MEVKVAPGNYTRAKLAHHHAYKFSSTEGCQAFNSYNNIFEVSLDINDFKYIFARKNISITIWCIPGILTNMMFLLVYFSVEVCLEGVFLHSVSTRRDPVRVYTPLTLAPVRTPLARKQNRTGVSDPALHLHQARGNLNWRMGLPALLGGNLGCWIV